MLILHRVTVLAIGNPLGITQTVTKGIISAVGRSVSEGQNGAIIPDAIQTDAPIDPGNSGGALVDLQGNVIGIPTLSAIGPQFKTPANGVGFAIPSNRVQFIVPQLIETGKVTHTGRAALGVTVTSVDATLAAQNELSVDHSALIVSVTPNGAAAQAGLKPGNVIVQIGDKTVDDVPSLGELHSYPRTQVRPFPCRSTGATCTSQSTSHSVNSRRSRRSQMCELMKGRNGEKSAQRAHSWTPHRCERGAPQKLSSL